MRNMIPLSIVSAALATCLVLPDLRNHAQVIVPVAIDAVVVLSTSEDDNSSDDTKGKGKGKRH